MRTEPTIDETTVSDRGAVTIPSAIRERLDVKPGDTVRWIIADDGAIRIDMINRRHGAFEGFEPVDIGETQAAEEHDRVRP